MRSEIEFKEFDAVSVKLEGSNLIEASAGTGKTYSIAILVLRLLLEKKLTVKEILMVTFTKAAVAELEERIRLFVRQAYRSAQGEDISDTTIRQLVERAVTESGEAEVSRLLREAVLFLDETYVLTIHSFCQLSLTEFAFETQQQFGAELLQDTSSLLEDEVNAFWREQITSIPTDILQLLLRQGLSRASLKAVVREHIAGKKFLIYKPSEDYHLDEEVFALFRSEYEQLNQLAEQRREDLIAYIRQHPDEIRSCCNANAYVKKHVLELADQPEELLNFIASKQSGAYVQKAFPVLIAGLEEYAELKDQAKKRLSVLLRRVCCQAIKVVSAALNRTKMAAGQIAFDDLIANLHAALVLRENPQLEARLQQKYKAVFIDEFQDTDRLQYEIFNKAFGSASILFYIGDPKQSIYAWRKADMETYFEARESVQNVYGMNRNYRSSKLFIEAMNGFFLPEPDFDTFYFGDGSSIEYIPVASPEPNSKGELMLGAAPAVPICVTELSKKDEIAEALAKQVLELLSREEYCISAKDGKRRIRPGDIGILVRSHTEGADIKRCLSVLNIPAVTIGDAKVLGSAEAPFVQYLLEAFESISRAAMNKALLSPFTGLSDAQLLQLDDEAVVELFRKYKALWEEEGIYPALNAFIADFGVNNALLKEGGYGERAITNLYQLVELLHKVQTRKRLSPLELISWLKRGIEGMETEGDEFEQRVESDEEAVNIVTIHKSKGLEYKIVLAPYLDLKTEKKHVPYWSFRDPQTGEYVSDHHEMLSDEHKAEYHRQAEQENRRLIYVALTRAVYTCFIYKSTREKSSSLNPFYYALLARPHPGILITDSIAIPPVERYERTVELPVIPAAKPVIFSLSQKNWTKMSYSMLRADHPLSLKNRNRDFKDEYGQFVFSELRSGAKTGNMLHYIFENIAFNNRDNWEKVIGQALLQFYGRQEDDRLASFLIRLLEEVLEAPLQMGSKRFRLNEIGMERRINEFEFDFNVTPFKVWDLNSLSGGGLDIEVKGFEELEGIMNGKIDLFFEHEGLFYVLDWKSNFLGDSLDDYTEESLLKAMNENNYHLQYLIYTLAVKKYLESRIPGFDYNAQFGGVIYLFVRGVRKTARCGIFKTKPDLSLIQRLGKILLNEEAVKRDAVYYQATLFDPAP